MLLPDQFGGVAVTFVDTSPEERNPPSWHGAVSTGSVAILVLGVLFGVLPLALAIAARPRAAVHDLPWRRGLATGGDDAAERRSRPRWDATSRRGPFASTR